MAAANSFANTIGMIGKGVALGGVAAAVGGISVALALALPASPHRGAIITVTYVVVLFSILVQGLTLSRLLRRTAR